MTNSLFADRPMASRCWLLFGFVVWGFSPLARATDRTWTGNSGVDNHWTTPGNWQGGVAPVAGDNLVFNGVANAGNSSNFNSFPAGTIFGKITIATASGQDFSLGGNRIVLTNGIAESAGGIGIMALAGSVYFDVTLGANQTFTASHSLFLKGALDTLGFDLTVNNSGAVTINGTVTNSSNGFPSSDLIKTNSGTLTIASSSQSILYVSVAQGVVLVQGQEPNSHFMATQGSIIADGLMGSINTENSNVTVSGTGFVSGLASVGDGVLGGAVRPGDNGAPGILSCSLFFPAGTVNPQVLEIIINGTAPGSGYSQLLASNYNLSLTNGQGTPEPVFSSTLEVQWNYVPQVGDSFLVLKSLSGAPYSPTNGIFSGLPRSSIYDVTNGSSLGVNYDANGVTLTTLRAPSSSFVLWKGSGFFGELETSGYGDRYWSSTNNWAQGIIPTSGGRVEFTPYQFSTADFDFNPPPPMTNDLPAGMSLASLAFSGTNYALYGNPVTIGEGITNTAANGTNSCYLGLATTGPTTLDVESAGTLLLGGSIAGSGTLSKVGGGTLIYTGTTMNAFVGNVAVNNGTLQMDGSFTDGSFSVNGGMLDGTGTISSVMVNNGTLKPGDSPGILHVQGNLTMSASAVFEAELNTPIPGSGYDQLQVSGSVNLNGATLNLQPGYAATPGTAFLILVSLGPNPITGTFAGLPEGAVFQAAGQSFAISYKAGSGNNDVLVTRVNPPPDFTKVSIISPGNIQLQGAGVSNVNYTIQANTNLAATNWINIGTAPADGSGHFSFNVTNLSSFPQRFFRALSP